jgi:hypothetical protein
VSLYFLVLRKSVTHGINRSAHGMKRYEGVSQEEAVLIVRIYRSCPCTARYLFGSTESQDTETKIVLGT